jgi:hypothetical protein
MRMRSMTAALLAVTLTVSTLGLPTAAAAATYIPLTPAQEVAGDGYAASSVADAGGRLHVVFLRYSQPGLWYATNLGGGWTTVKVAVTQGTPHLAIDGSGRLYAVQTDEGASPGVHLTTNRSGSWTTIRLTSEATDRFPSIAVDSLGEVHIAFGEASVEYLTNRLGYWVRRTIASSGAHPSIALDANRRVHIAYESSGGIRHVTDANGVSWVTGTVNATGSRPSLSIRGSAMAVAFGRGGVGVYLATKGSTGWSSGRIGTAIMQWDTGPSLRLDQAGKAHVTYVQYAPSGIQLVDYASNASGSWVVTTIGTGGAPSTVLAPAGAVHITYSTSALYHRSMSASSWLAASIAASVYDLHPEVATGADGLARIVYATPWTTPGLRAGTWNGSGFGQTRITTSEDREPAIAVDPNGASHLAFVRIGTPTTLWYGTNAGGPWTFEQIASDDGFACPDIALGQDGHVHVSAQRTHVDAGFTYYRPVWYTDASGSWVVRDDLPIITGTGCPAIAVDAEDEPHLTYSEASSVYIAQLVAGDWTHTTFGDGTLRAGRIVLTEDGTTYVSYARPNDYSSTLGGLWVRTDATGPWTSARVGKTADENARHGLAVDAAGHVHVAYRGFIWDPGIHYATDASGSWVSLLLRDQDVSGAALSVSADGTADIVVAQGSTGGGINGGVVHIHD